MPAALGIESAPGGGLAWCLFSGPRSHRSGVSSVGEAAALAGSSAVLCHDSALALPDALAAAAGPARIIRADPDAVRSRLGVEGPLGLGVRLGSGEPHIVRAFFCAFMGHLSLCNASVASGGSALPSFSVAELAAEQELLAREVSLSWDGREVGLIGGVDEAFTDDRIVSCALAVDVASGELVDLSTSVSPVTFPYIPGLLSYREGPAIEACVAGLRAVPDVLLVNGCGIDHPRGVGLASHVGLRCRLPTVGVTRRPLCGRSDRSGPGPWPLLHKGAMVGYAVEPRTGARPVYVSPGHLVDLDTALALVRPLFRGAGLPLPLAEAHRRCTAERDRLVASCSPSHA